LTREDDQDFRCDFCNKLICPECNDCQNEFCYESYKCKCEEYDMEDEEDPCFCRDGEINPMCPGCFC